MPARRQLLQKVTLSSTASTVTFSNIPQTYTDLRLVAAARTSRTGFTADSAIMRFNGDTTSGNYSLRRVIGNGSSVSSSTNWSGLFTATASSTANTFGNSEAYIPNYTSSSAKASLIHSSSEHNGTEGYSALTAYLWSGTAAITSIELAVEVTGPFVAGSTFYLYGLTQVPVIVGGAETISGGYKIHTFTSTSSLRVVEAGQVEYLVVSGGGGGASGGGGAGGLLTGFLSVAAQTYSVTVGAGGAAGTTETSGVQASSGNGSTFASISPNGGGRASRTGDVGGANDAASGGSGGGGGAWAGGTTNGAAGTSGQGNSGGGNGGFVASPYTSGGGGGAGANGSNASSSTVSGVGGAGRSVSISGSPVFYAGGGGGGVYLSATPGAGGSGGGGNGGTNSINGVAGETNRGGGGGGAGNTRTAGAGGSGIVIIRYPYISN